MVEMLVRRITKLGRDSDSERMWCTDVVIEIGNQKFSVLELAKLALNREA